MKAGRLTTKTGKLEYTKKRGFLYNPYFVLS
jgi:hypothetical protein